MSVIEVIDWRIPDIAWAVGLTADNAAITLEGRQMTEPDSANTVFHFSI
jgi:hypothetical protein